MCGSRFTRRQHASACFIIPLGNMSFPATLALSVERFIDSLHGATLRDAESRAPPPLAVLADQHAPELPFTLVPWRGVVVALDRDGILPTGWDRLADVLLTTAQAAPAPWVAIGVQDWEHNWACIANNIAACPTAATVLVDVLRAAQGSDFYHALIFESLAYSTLLAGPEFAVWRRTRATRASKPDDEGPGGVRVRRDGNVLAVTLARPAAHNALSALMRFELASALQLAAADSSLTRVVLRGDGVSFCAGGDLDEFGSAPDPVSAHLIRMQQSACALLDPIRHRVQVHVHGACIGAGIEIAACAGRVVARADTHFRLPELTMGLIPGAGGTASLARRIGRHRTAFLALSGLPLDSTSALRWGLIDAIEHVDRV